MTGLRLLRYDRGMALLAVLVMLMVVAGVAASFVWLMDQQQTRAGMRLRSIASLAAAEAGIHRALAVLESVTPEGDGAGRAWRPLAYTEGFHSGPLNGRFTLTLADEPGGVIQVTSVGEIAGVTRRVRARVHLASRSMLTALYGAGLVRIDNARAQIVVAIYGPGAGNLPWVHVAAGGGVAFGAADAVINDPTARVVVGAGPVDTPGLIGTLAGAIEPVRLLLARGAQLTVGPDYRRVDVQQLRVMGMQVDGNVVWTDSFPKAPHIDQQFMQAQAALNVSNAELNEAAGRFVGDDALIAKHDGLYTEDQFAALQTYLLTQTRHVILRGVVYVIGAVTLSEHQKMTIADGTLITEGPLRLRRGASLDIIHSAATRTLPGVLVLDRRLSPGILIVAHDAQIRAHGLVYARSVDVWEGARLDVVGAVVGMDPEISFRNLGGSVVIRYDPAVLGTPGLKPADNAPVIAWIAAWEELP